MTFVAVLDFLSRRRLQVGGGLGAKQQRRLAFVVKTWQLTRYLVIGTLLLSLSLSLALFLQLLAKSLLLLLLQANLLLLPPIDSFF